MEVLQNVLLPIYLMAPMEPTSIYFFFFFFFYLTHTIDHISHIAHNKQTLLGMSESVKH